MNRNHHTYKTETALDGDLPWEPVMELSTGRVRHSLQGRHLVNRAIRMGRTDHEVMSGVAA